METIDVRPAVIGTIEALGIGRLYHNFWWDRVSRRHSPWTDWSRKNRVVFIHVPKNAGTSLYETFGMDVPENTHCPVTGYLASDAARYHDSYSFGFVRNSDWSGRNAVDYIGRFETLAKDVDIIGDAIGVTPQLMFKNSTERKHYFNYYTPESRRLVARIYAKDISRYDYAWQS